MQHLSQYRFKDLAFAATQSGGRIQTELEQLYYKSTIFRCILLYFPHPILTFRVSTCRNSCLPAYAAAAVREVRL